MGRAWYRIAVGAALSLVGCRDARITNLEKRVDHLEQSIRQLKAEQRKATDEDLARRSKLEICVADSDAQYDEMARRNGTKRRDGSWTIPVPVLEQMQRQKQAKIEECKLLYSK